MSGLVPFMYVSYNIARSPSLFGDQVMLDDLLPGQFTKIQGFNSSHEGAVVTVALFHNEDYIDQLNADISRLKWVVLILTSNENGSEAYKKIKHPNIKIWLQTPKLDDVADRFLPIGYPSLIEFKSVDKSLDWMFAGQVTNPRRVECVEVLKTLSNGDLLSTEGFNQGYPYDEYIEHMRQARFVPCPSAPATPDTFRVYEALECGAMPIVDEVSYWDKVMPGHPFKSVDKWSEVSFDNWEGPSEWWSIYKLSLVENLLSDVAELKAKV